MTQSYKDMGKLSANYIIMVVFPTNSSQLCISACKPTRNVLNMVFYSLIMTDLIS
jgi:hypothetical protein